ncbi:MAG: hypothetical protein KDB14_01245 [Planctomycetales bacterium]|nr:hypothetical protein [Planctomycetales bacterium]
MKWMLFSMACALGVPTMSVAALWSDARRWLCAGLVASTVLKVSVNFYSMELYRGADRGYEVGLTDLFALSMAIGIIGTNFRRVRWVPFNAPVLFALGVFLCVSTAYAASPLLASFTLFKAAKAGLIYWTVYNYVHLDNDLQGLWWGAVAAAIVLSCTVAWQKYGQGLYRPHGTFDHSNTIPAYCLMLIPFLLAWLLHARQHPWKLGLSLGALMGLCFSVVATLSRAGAAAMGGAIVSVLLYGLIRQPLNQRRAAVAALLGVCLLIGVAKSSDTLIERFLHAPEASHRARDEFNVAAGMMARDHLFGVGLNCFSRVLTDTPRYRDHVEVMKNEEQAGVCHHIYWLTVAETGWLGASLFGLAILRFWARLLRPGLAGAAFSQLILLSMAVGIFAVHLIGLYEWVLRITPVFHLFVIVTGISVALAERVDLSCPQGKQSWPKWWLRRRARRRHRPRLDVSPGALAPAGRMGLTRCQREVRSQWIERRAR